MKVALIIVCAWLLLCVWLIQGCTADGVHDRLEAPLMLCARACVERFHGDSTLFAVTIGADASLVGCDCIDAQGQMRIITDDCGGVRDDVREGCVEF